MSRFRQKRGGLTWLSLAKSARAIVLFTSCTLQIDSPRIPAERDFGDLYERASSSRVVVVALAGKPKGVAKRMTADLREKVKVDLSAAYAGGLLSLRVTETVCHQEDFRVGASQAQLAPTIESPLLIFLPRDEAPYMNGQMTEYVIEGRLYLVFLSEPDTKKHQEWVDSFQLDPARTYYRATERSRGVVQLAPAIRPGSKDGVVFLQKVTRLCAAVRPPTLEGKLLELKKLAESGDPVLQREAEIAANALRAQVKPPRQ